jgi:8-oxo-dGTP pyrophosphatase MutT (NUDIX family)
MPIFVIDFKMLRYALFLELYKITNKIMPKTTNETTNNWTTIDSTEVYSNAWIEVTHRNVINPSGGAGIYGVVHFKNIAIGIVPLDAEYNTWLVGQYRYTLGAYSWEIPEGGGAIGVPPLESAQRELLEETGISAQKWTQLLEVHTSNSVTDEYGIAYIAQELTFGEAMPEETEDLKVLKLPFAKAVEMVLKGEITDGFAMVAILKTDAWIRQGLI